MAAAIVTIETNGTVATIECCNGQHELAAIGIIYRWLSHLQNRIGS